jgi:hypothetical protein
MSANITNIPTELVGYIFQHLDVADICSLRLACSALYSRTEEPFKDFFSHINTDLTEKSLRMLLGISSHAMLAPVVKTIPVIAGGYETRVLARQLESGEKHVSTFRGMICRTETVKLTEEELAEVRALSDFFSQGAAELDRVRVAGLDASLLSAAFRNLVNLGVKLRTLSLEAALYEESRERLPADQEYLNLAISSKLIMYSLLPWLHLWRVVLRLLSACKFSVGSGDALCLLTKFRSCTT